MKKLEISQSKLNAAKFILFFSLLGSLSISVAGDRRYAPENDWSKYGPVDFCPQSNRLDFRNAYWLGAMSTYSYWHLDVLEKIMKPTAGKDIQLEFTLDSNGQPLPNKTYITKGLGFGEISTQYFSSRIPKPEDTVTKDYDRELLTINHLPPLPREACIIPGMSHCFDKISSNQMQVDNSNGCGFYKENVFFSTTRLAKIRKHILEKRGVPVEGLQLTQEERYQAEEDQKHIQSSVEDYEKKIQTSVHLDWTLPEAINRCKSYIDKEINLKPDTQGSIFESKDAVFIIFRGTEGNIENDVKTDAFALNKFDFSGKHHNLDPNTPIASSVVEWDETAQAHIMRQVNPEKNSETKNILAQWPNSSGQVHYGFFLGIEEIKPWVLRKLNSIQQKWKVNQIPPKPIFITGHSLGGALANLMTYNLLGINKKAKDKKKTPPYNIKAMYTFGAPRVGDEEWAQSMKTLADEFNIGLYRFINRNDVVPHIPCVGYYHVGTNIYVESADNNPNTITQILFNSIGINTKSMLYNDLNSCAYGTILDKVVNFSLDKVKGAVNDHFMTSYFGPLKNLREQVNQSIGIKLSDSQETVTSANRCSLDSNPMNKSAEKDMMLKTAIDVNFSLPENKVETDSTSMLKNFFNKFNPIK